MASTTFVDQSTVIYASWLNDVNTATYTTVPTLTTNLTALATTVQNSSSQVLSSVAGTNTITGSLTPALTAYATGQTFRFTAAGANTGATTININGLGAKAITKSGTTPLVAGDIPNGAVVQVTYDGTQFQLVSGAGSSGGAVANGTLLETKHSITADYTLTTGASAVNVGNFTVADGFNLTIPTGEAVVVLSTDVNPAADNVTPITTGTQTIYGTKTFANMPLVGGVDVSSIGVNQTWQNVIGSRTSGTTYTNSTSKPIVVSVTTGGAGVASLVIGGVTVATLAAGAQQQISGIVPVGATYVVTTTTAQSWAELR